MTDIRQEARRRLAAEYEAPTQGSGRSAGGYVGYVPEEAALRAIEAALSLSAVRGKGVEEAAKVADKHAQRARDAIGKCKAWSPAQAEWSRARDMALDIAEDIRSLTPAVDSNSKEE